MLACNDNGDLRQEIRDALHRFCMFCAAFSVLEIHSLARDDLNPAGTDDPGNHHRIVEHALRGLQRRFVERVGRIAFGLGPENQLQR